MATRSRTYKTTDWQVWTYVPESGAFRLGFSQLNGTDVLGSTGGSMTASNAEITMLTITEGGAVTNGFQTDPKAAEMQCELLIKDYTIDDAQNYLVGSPIWVTLKNEETLPDLRFGLNTPMFVGRISSFLASGSSDSDFTTVSLSASSKTADMLNLYLTVARGTTYDKYLYIADSASVQYPFPVNPYNSALSNSLEASCDLQRIQNYRTYNFANTTTETQSMGEWLTDYTHAELAPVVDNIKPYFYQYNDGTNVFIDYSASLELVYYSPYAPLVKRTYTDDDIYSAQMEWSGAGCPTGVNLTLASNDAIIYQYGTTPNNNLSNGYIHNETFDVKNVIELATIGQNMLSMFPKYCPTMIAVEIARTNQTIVYEDESDWFTASPTSKKYLNPERLCYSGDQIKVTLDKYGISEQIMIITGKRINVTTDNFTVEYDLWKGITA